MSAKGKVISIEVAVERRRHKLIRDVLSETAGADEGGDGDPDSHGLLTMIGNISLLGGAYDNAIEAFSRALSTAPDDVDARKGRGRAYLGIDEFDLALSDFEKALALAPDAADLHYYRGHCLEGLIQARFSRGVDDTETAGAGRSRNASALASLEKALALGFRHAGVYYAILRVREALGDEDELLATLDRALVALPDEIPLLQFRHSRRLHGGDVEGAAADHARLQELGVKD